MELKVNRTNLTEISTVGDMLIDGVFFCYVLEDRVREGKKVPGETAIPAGRYRVVIDFSNRFQKPMPHILDVPNFEGIRIHAGNAAANTDGCLLLGMTKSKDSIGSSKAAIAKFTPRLEAGLKEGEVFITIG